MNNIAMHKQEFQVGDRVRVRIATDVVPEKEIQCDVGYVIDVHLFLAGTRMERLQYTIRLDGKYCHFLGPDVTISKGYNIDDSTSSMERI